LIDFGKIDKPNENSVNQTPIPALKLNSKPPSRVIDRRIDQTQQILYESKTKNAHPE